MKNFFSLNVHYRLVNGANFIVMPQPAIKNGLSVVYLKTRKSISIAHNNTLKVPTGVEIVQYPNIELDSTPKLAFCTVAKCIEIPELAEKEGIVVLGPRLLTSEDTGEIYVTIKNTNKEIFSADRGDPVALMLFDFLPMLDLSLSNK